MSEQISGIELALENGAVLVQDDGHVPTPEGTDTDIVSLIESFAATVQLWIEDQSITDIKAMIEVDKETAAFNGWAAPGEGTWISTILESYVHTMVNVFGGDAA